MKFNYKKQKKGGRWGWGDERMILNDDLTMTNGWLSDDDYLIIIVRNYSLKKLSKCETKKYLFYLTN